MTQKELIDAFAATASIADRVLLVGPADLAGLRDKTVQECRMFLLVEAGRVKVRVGSEAVEVRENMLVDMLVWEPISFVDVSEGTRGWCLFPNYVFTNESLNGLKPADSESFKDRHELPLLELAVEETARLAVHLELLRGALADLEHHYRLELCQTYFRGFMLEAGNMVLKKRKEHDEPEGVETRQDMILRSFLKLVWRYYKSEHNVDFYAGRLCISSKHLSRVVKARLGKTPYAVIRDELLEQASEQLKTTKKSVDEISSDLHFAEVSSFCKFFKKHKGVSPGAYRSC